MTVVKDIRIRLELKNKDEFNRQVVDYLMNHRKLKPVRIGYTTDYAESLEYGTGPLKNIQSTVDNGNYTYDTIYAQLYEWAGKKDGKNGFLPIKDKGERSRFAKNLTDRFFEEGMKPHPYWRPAINWLLDNEQRLFDEGYSLYEIADETLRIANKCIMDQNLPFSGNLQLSAFIDEIVDDDDKDARDYSDDEKNRLFKQVGWI